MERACHTMTQDYKTYTDVSSEVSDAHLARQAQAGERAAFAALYRRYLLKVYRYFYVRTGAVQLAEDLTSQTFMAALESLPRYRERGMFAAWLFAIASRRYVDTCRSQTAIPPEVVDDPPDPAPSPEAALVHAERMAGLAQALRALPPGRAQAVALHFFGGLTHKETARAMGRSRIAVKSLINRALRDLREKLDDG
jgi:RNA polymerase sigma-70 factor (ECF subfamily)